MANKTVEKVAIIGRALSGTYEIESKIEALKTKGLTFGGDEFTYFGPVDPGLAYRKENDPDLAELYELAILNRSASVMTGYKGRFADYVAFLERQFKSGVLARLYKDGNFPPRYTFGDHILATNASHDARVEALGGKLHRVESFVAATRNEKDGTITIILADGTEQKGFTKVVNATGHTIKEIAPALAARPDFVAPYVQNNWLRKIYDWQRAAIAATQRGGEIVVSPQNKIDTPKVVSAGGGGTSLDTALLAEHGTKAKLVFYSEWGETAQPFFHGVSPTPAITKKIRTHLDTFFAEENLDDVNFKVHGDSTAIRSKVGDKIRALLAAIEAENPKERLGPGEYKYPEGYVYPQFVYAELLQHAAIKRPENKIVQAGVVVFNGNPLAAERLKQYEEVQDAGRIEIVRARLKVTEKGAGEFWLHVDGEAPKPFKGLVIDAGGIDRGIVLDAENLPVNPLLRGQFNDGSNHVSRVDPRVLPKYTDDPRYDNRGAGTIGDANSAGIFANDADLDAIHYAALRSGSISPSELHQLLVDRRKDGGRPIRILDLRRPDERTKAAFVEHPSLGIINIDYDAAKKQGTLEQSLAALPKDNIPTFVICAGGVRSLKAQNALEEQGYQNLVDVRGGFGQLVPQAKTLPHIDYYIGSSITERRKSIESGGPIPAADVCGAPSTATSLPQPSSGNTARQAAVAFIGTAGRAARSVFGL